MHSCQQNHSEQIIIPLSQSPNIFQYQSSIISIKQVFKYQPSFKVYLPMIQNDIKEQSILKLIDIHINDKQKQKTKQSLMHLLNLTKYIIIIFIFFNNLLTISNCGLTPSNIYATQLSNYVVDFQNYTTNVPAGAVILITFPKQYSPYQLQKSIPYSGNDLTAPDTCPVDCTSVTITYSAYTFVLYGMFPSATYLYLSYTIFNIKNPIYKTKTNSFIIKVKTSDFVTTIYSENVTGITIAAPQFQSLSSTLNFPYLWEIVDASFDITITSDTDFITIIFPTKWQNQTQINSTTLSTVQINSSTHAVTFTKTLQTFTIYFPQIYSTQSLKLTLKSVYTPSSVMNMGPISFLGYNYQNQIIRETTFYIPSTQLTFDFIRQLESSVSYDQVTNKITFKIKFKLPRNSIKNDKILITYPPQITISSLPADYQVYISSDQVTASPSFPGSNLLRITPFSSSYFQPNLQVDMTIAWPRSVIYTSNFKIESFRKIGAGYSKMQEAQCCALWIKQKATLIASLTVDNNQRLKSGILYTFGLTHSFAILLATDSIFIQFPTVFQLNSTKQATICPTIVIDLPSNVSNLNTFSCSLSSNVLTLSNIIKSSQNPALLTIKVTLTNPSSTPNENFQVWSQDASGLKIQSNNLLSLTISSASLNSVVIAPTNLFTNQQSNYVMTISAIGTIVKNTMIKLYVPYEVRLLEYSLICKINSVQQFCSYDKINNIAKILSSTNLASTSFQINLLNLINPETNAQTSDFEIQIYNPAGKLVQSSISLLSGVNVQMSQFDTFLYTKMWMDVINLDSKGDLKFIVATNIALLSGQTYKIDIILTPRAMLYFDKTISLLTFDGVSLLYASSNTTSQLLISITFSPSINKNLFEFQFSDTYVFQDKFTATLTLSKQISLLFYQSVNTASAISLQSGLNSVLISNYQITQTNYFMNESPGTINININTVSPNITFSSVIINIPKNYQSVSNSYEYTSPTDLTTISFTIGDLLNPIQITQEPFSFLLYDSLGEIVGISSPSNQYYQTKCTFPCKNCKSLAQPALCVDCYQISSNSKIYFRQTQTPYGICTDICQEGQYLDVSLKKCIPCSTNCSSCLIQSGAGSGDPQKCLTCALNLYLLSNRCYTICPDGYYSNNLVCSLCINNCAKCTGLNSCSQCSVSFVFYSGKQFLIQVIFCLFLGNCLSSCPLKTVSTLIPSTIRSQCLSCSSNCLTCTDVNACTLCDNNFYLYGNICLATCPFSGTQLYPDLNNVCKPCECQSCINQSYNCTSCALGYIFDPSAFKCMIKCSDGFYNNSNACQSCASDCLICLSLNNCQICKQPFILYQINSTNSQCVSQCPNSSILTIQTSIASNHILQCLPCTLGCSICILSSTFCTQCSTGYIFLNNLCLLACPVGYHNISNYCKKCVSECAACNINDPRNCSQCTQGYYLQNQFCYANCPQGTYAETTLKKCFNCQTLCQTCMNATHCTSCKAGLYLFPNNLCYSSCPTTPDYYYTFNSQCMKCQPQCTTCLSSPIECSSCSSSYFYQNQDTLTCSTTCDANYFVKGKKCIKCQPPCMQCDTTYASCISCLNTSSLKYVFQGQCYEVCPSGYYSGTFTNLTITIENKCINCPFPCLTCTKQQCLTCQTFAFMYKKTCVLTCQQTIDMPYQKDTYCTSCLSIPFCTFCQSTQINSLLCWSCTYPYVLFEGQCLNQCPSNYEISSSAQRICKQSQQYLRLKEQIYERNKPIIPFGFVIFFVIICALVYPISKLLYTYTYNVGYWIFVINVLDYILVYDWLIKQDKKYEGEYFDGQQRGLPFDIIIIGLGINLIILGWILFGYVIRYIYLKDVRYQEWKNNHYYNFISVIISIIVFGPKSHKLYYSKLFGLQQFSFRIISVDKFYFQDRINFLSCFGDIIILIAFIIVAYNNFISYSVLYLTSIQIFIIKIITWILLIFDSKKPDRGFFYGDQKTALEQIEKQQEQHLSKLRRVDTDHLIKMIRQKSACQLEYNRHPFGQFDKYQTMSVYAPDDYQQVPIVPLKKIQRNINKGRFRKGRKITIQQKLQRFADSIKPKPKIIDKQEYLHGRIYWKPPKKIKNSKQLRIQPISQQSMLKILQNKQMQYKQQLDEIENIVFEQKSQKQNTHNFRTGQFFYKNSNKLNIESYDHLDDSNGSIQQFEDLSSQIFKASRQQIQYNDLMNLNYARKRHLAHEQKKPHFDDNDMRILYHQPMKRRVSKLKK